MNLGNNLQQNTTKDHKCVSLDSFHNYIQTCNLCGIMMDKTNQNKTFHRSNIFQLDHFRNDGNRVFDQMFEKQANNRTFNQSPPHLQFRAALMHYVKQLSKNLGYKKKTYHLSVTIIDQVFSKCKIQNSEVNMIAVVCLMIAAKMEENDSKIPCIEQIASKLNGKFTKHEFVSCECTVFSKILNFNANINTSYDFVTEFLYRGVLSGKEIGWNVIRKEHSMELINFFQEIVEAFIDFASEHYEFYYFTAPAVAAASLACARKIFGTEEIWNQDMTNLTRYSLQYIQQCSNLLIQLFAIEQEKTLDDFFAKRNELKEKIRENYFFGQSPISASQSSYIQDSDIQNISSLSFQQDNFIIEEHEGDVISLEDSMDQSRLFYQESTQESLSRIESQSNVQGYKREFTKSNHDDLMHQQSKVQNKLNKTNCQKSIKESL